MSFRRWLIGSSEFQGKMLSRNLIRCVRSYAPKNNNDYSTQKLRNSAVTAKRNEVFKKEKERQLSLVTRIEKIQVEHKGPPEDCTLLMNKNLSTPFNCAMHVQELLMQRSVLALVNGQPWDMHRPLEEDCELEFSHFKNDNPHHVNQAFWRSCSFFLGYILERAFKDDFYVELCSFPKPNIQSGSFVYDADLNLPEWEPTAAELNCLSRLGGQLPHTDMKLERLDVDASVAMRMFEDNRFKREQIPQIAAQSASGSSVTVYRMGDHTDISRGPLIASSKQLSRFQIAAIHSIQSPDFGPLKRIQGLAMPNQLKTHYWSFNLLCERAAKLNPAPVPSVGHSEKQINFNGNGI